MLSRQWICAAGLAVMLCGCASLPTSGSIHVGRSLPGVSGFENDEIRAFPSGPLVGQTPTGIVTGYLDALIDPDNNYGVARLFLGPNTSWNSSSGITLYDQSSEVVTRTGSGKVDVTMTRVGVIDPHDRYRVAPGQVDATFRVVRRAGQWRITHLPPGVLLSASDAQRSLQSANLFYLNRAGTSLVPSPVLVPLDQPGIATTLVEALLHRPPPEIAAGAVTAAPEGLDLIANVPVGADGIAEVNLSGGTQRISASGLQRLSAQIVWTLRQIPGVTAVRLLDNGTPLTDIGVPRVQPIGAWQQFDPDVPPTSRGALLSSRGVVVGLGRTAPDAFGRQRIYAPIVSANGAEAAGLLPRVRGHRSLVMGSTIAQVRPRLSGPGLSAPVFGPAGQVYVVRGVGSAAGIVEVPTQGRPREVAVPATVRAQGLSGLAISRDGSRAAMVVGPAGERSLVVGALSAGREPRINGVSVVIPGTRDVRSIAWAGATELVTTGITNRGRRAVMRTSIDGYHPHFLSSVGLPPNPHQVAAAPGQPILTTAGGGIWSLSDRRWHRVSTGRDPSYAG